MLAVCSHDVASWLQPCQPSVCLLSLLQSIPAYFCLFFLGDFFLLVPCRASIPESNLRTVHDAGGRKHPNGVIACLGPGTGLGEVYAVPTGAADGDYIVCPSEGSMSDFVPRTQDEWELRQWLASRDGGFVEVEKVASGTRVLPSGTCTV